jgi:hypothetical protein
MNRTSDSQAELENKFRKRSLIMYYNQPRFGTRGSSEGAAKQT